MILAEAVSGEEGAEILDRLVELKPEKGMVSPYMNHHFVEALLKCGKKEQAMDYMKYYWGGMLSHGADTFWEAVHRLIFSENILSEKRITKTIFEYPHEYD